MRTWMIETMADDNTVQECARPVSPVTMRPALSSVSVSHSIAQPLYMPADSITASIVGRPRHHGYATSHSSSSLNGNSDKSAVS